MMTEAWKPFTDEEMRKIIEGERINGMKEENVISVVKRSNVRVMRGRAFKRNADVQERDKIVDTNGSQNDKKMVGKCIAGLRIPKIPEEKEEEVDEAEMTEPVLKSQSVDVAVRRHSEPGNSSARSGVDLVVLEKFQEKQKVMEEKNKQNKELLQRALSDRAKKTREEVEKLNHIEEELKKLDNMLSNDVTIIRNQIELASQEYLEAQKRYDRAEKEYIAAKLNLFNYKERKEMLTSHLCTIIEKNELRKAQKLSDLMRRLEMGMDIASLTLEDSDDLKEESSSRSNSPVVL